LDNVSANIITTIVMGVLAGGRWDILGLTVIMSQWKAALVYALMLTGTLRILGWVLKPFDKKNDENTESVIDRSLFSKNNAGRDQIIVGGDVLSVAGDLHQHQPPEDKSAIEAHLEIVPKSGYDDQGRHWIYFYIINKGEADITDVTANLEFFRLVVPSYGTADMTNIFNANNEDLEWPKFKSGTVTLRGSGGRERLNIISSFYEHPMVRLALSGGGGDNEGLIPMPYFLGVSIRGLIANRPMKPKIFCGLLEPRMGRWPEVESFQHVRKVEPDGTLGVEIEIRSNPEQRNFYIFEFTFKECSRMADK
jgi:hypothetical protein